MCVDLLTVVTYERRVYKTLPRKNRYGQGDNPQERPGCTGNPQRLYVRELSMKLEAQWITGFVDGEGCFHVAVNKHDDMKCGYQVLPEFTVVQHERDVQILHALKAHFKCGVVRVNHGDRMCWRVRKLEHLLKYIVPFFDKHPLKSKKRVDYEKFRRALLKMEKGDHLTPDGVDGIRRIAAQMSRGSSR